MSLRVRRAGLLGTLTAFALVGASLAATPIAAGATGTVPTAAAEAGDPTPVMPDERVVMGQYPTSDFTAQAAEVAPDLAQAIAADTGGTPEDYLANAAAAADAVSVVDALTGEGVDVLGSRLDGTSLIVNVASESDVAAVEAANATAEIGAPETPDFSSYDVSLQKDLVGGQAYAFTQGSGRYSCSVGFNGTDVSTGKPAFLTAGHCYPTSGVLSELVQPRPDAVSSTGITLGSQLAGALNFGDGFDANLISTASGWTPRPQVGTWGGNAGAVGSGVSTVRDYSRAIEGQVICKSGRTSGWTCGHVLAVDYLADVEGTQINSYVSDMCSLHGDSGGAVVSGPNAIGLVSFGSYQNCSETDQISGTFPISSSRQNVISRLSMWEIAVQASAPVITAPTPGAPLYQGQSLRGTLPYGSTHFTVQGWLDGAPVFIPVNPDGTWSLDLQNKAVGEHTYRLHAAFGSGSSVSTEITGGFTIAAKPTVDRIQGADRFDVAVAVAEREFPGATTAPVVYVATGLTYPDALSAGPAAAKEGGPLLLVTKDDVPTAAAEKIARLNPGRIIVVGGPNSVSEAVVTTLESLVPGVDVQRRSGADRYEAGRAVVAGAFGSVAHAYAATGSTFPDALSAGGAAGSERVPVVLVNGGAATVSTPTLDLFRTMGTDSITVVGGVNSVRPEVVTSLGTVPAAVNRIDGADRFQASINLNAFAFQSASTAYLATGYNFPDALAGGVLAGMSDAPLYVVPTECVPTGVLAEFTRLGVKDVVLLGGPNSLSPAVANLTACSF
ncbi:cell wall-binding repeat-containing protein [Herbiconiux sp. YIM B11900]|uniref:cell wall-binding repeat-containing protein n=1 Tax=Herbiconiux sp. YIM B11900 TaxID=3404131 RepID=UPI003F84D055